MPTFSGYRYEDLSYLSIPNYTTSWTGEHPRPASIVGGKHPSQFSSGSFSESRPIDIRSLEKAGWNKILPSYFDDYYQRIHLIPFVLNLEWVTTLTTAPVVLWNAFLETVTLTNISEFNGEGVSLQNLSVPQSFKPLQFHNFSVIAQPDGPPQIQTTYTLTFAGFTSVTLRVIGTRATLWEFPPNWAEGVDIQYNYKTEIITSRSGKEQRRALRNTARRTISFNALAPGEKFQKFVRVMAGRQHRSFVLPEYTRYVPLAVRATPGADRITLDSIPAWISEEQTIALVQGYNVEVQTIAMISGNQLIFTGTLRREWPVGTKVCPALSGYMSTRLQAREHTNELLNVEVEFDVSPGANAYAPSGSAPQTYNGRELFLVRPNWIRPVRAVFESYRQTVDYGHGRIAQFNPVEFTTRYHEAAYLGKTNAEVDSIVAFFDRMRGQQGEFYMPTWTDDFRPKVELRAGAQSMRIAGTEFATDYGKSKVFKNFVLFLENGDVILRTMRNVYEIDDFDGRDTGIEITEPWPYDIALADIRMCCWLPVWRFATDTLNVEWVTDGVAQFMLNFRTVEDLEGF